MSKKTSNHHAGQETKSIYEQSFFSRINQVLIRRYPLFFWLALTAFVLTLLLQIAQCCHWWRCFGVDKMEKNLLYELFSCVRCIYLSAQGYINSFFGENAISLFGIIISLLSVMAAAFSVAFGNFKICSINANLVLKQIYGGGKKRISARIVMLTLGTPVALVTEIAARANVLFVVTFLIAFFNLIYMLDICLTLFTDNGVKYVEIPDNLSRELQQNVCKPRQVSDSPNRERERLLYDGFVQNISCDDYSVNVIVVPSVVRSIQEQDYSGVIPKKSRPPQTEPNPLDCTLKTHAIYHHTYQFFFDIRRYLYRNTADKTDFLDTYFSLCSVTLHTMISEYLAERYGYRKKKRKKNKAEYSLSDCYSICMAIFRNVMEAMRMKDDHLFSKIYDAQLTKMLNDLNDDLKSFQWNCFSDEKDLSAVFGEFQDDIVIMVLMVIFQMEYEITGNHSKENLSDIGKAVDLLFSRVYSHFSAILRPKGLNKTDQNYNRVNRIIKSAKSIHLQLSSGLNDNDYEHKLDIHKNTVCTKRIIEDLYLYTMPDKTRGHHAVKLTSTFVFIYESFLRGGQGS